jgi:hypothetical protein
MARNPIPKIALGWGIAALHRHVDEAQAQATALHVLEQQDDLPEHVFDAYRQVVNQIRVLESNLVRFESAAKQGGIPFEETV